VQDSPEQLRKCWETADVGQKRLGAAIETVQKGLDRAPEGTYRHILLMSRKMA
jgi:hypothetical protein